MSYREKLRSFTLRLRLATTEAEQASILSEKQRFIEMIERTKVISIEDYKRERQEGSGTPVS